MDSQKAPSLLATALVMNLLWITAGKEQRQRRFSAERKRRGLETQTTLNVG